jgi:hypothetical protein
MITNTAFRPLFLLLGTVLVLGACASLTDVEMIYIEIATDRTEYALGDTVILSVTNRGTEPYRAPDFVGQRFAAVGG